MQCKELITVIVPVYNVQLYLQRCIDTIICQTYTKLEILLVDDGSTDDSGKICDEYKNKDSRIKVIHKPNGGLSSARNAAISVAQGEYLVCIDSDDWVSLDHIEYLYYLIKKYNADFSMASFLRTKKEIVERKRESYNERLLNQSEFLKRFFKVGTQENVQYAWCKLYRKSLFDNIRYPVGVISEDVPTIFEIALKSSRIAYSDRVIYYYFVNYEGITQKPFSLKNCDLLKVWTMVVEKAYEFKDKDIIRLAEINYHRAYLGLLCNLNMQKIKEDEIREVQVLEKSLKKKLKQYEKELLYCDIPLSRKLLILGFCHAYPLVALTLRMFVKIKQM